tara:strand:+ start:935 stop:1345 length:411 start_codon:yes stop_codon:yes gene_type:complete
MLQLAKLKALCLLFWLAGVSLPAVSHHSFGMFDMASFEPLEGKVIAFQWTNPHVILWVEKHALEGAEPERWGIELTSPGNLQRAGITRRSLNPGDEIKVIMSPLRSGNAGGAFRSVENFTTGMSYQYDYGEVGSLQ